MRQSAGAVIRYAGCAERKAEIFNEDRDLAPCSPGLRFYCRCTRTIGTWTLGMEDANHPRPARQGRSLARLLPIAANQRSLPILLLSEPRRCGTTGDTEADRPAAQIAHSGRGSALEYRRRSARQAPQQADGACE